LPSPLRRPARPGGEIIVRCAWSSSASANRDALTRKWVRARHVAERHVIAERYAEFEIIGEPKIREVDPDARYFNPADAER